MYAFMPALIRYFLAEEQLLPQVDSTSASGATTTRTCARTSTSWW